MSERDLDRVWCRARPRLNAACDELTLGEVLVLLHDPDRGESVVGLLVWLYVMLVLMGYAKAWLA